MNKFIFDGYYDNILNSFVWQNINICIPLEYNLEKDFKQSKYALKIEHKVVPMEQMKPFNFSLNSSDCIGKVLIYNPDKWKYTEYYFYKNLPINNISGKIYKILHLSM